MKKILRILLLFLLVLFIGSQFIRPAPIVEAVDPRVDLVAVTNPPAEVERLLRVACYDCHSGQPRYPWYANITPVNWWLTSHIHEGREKFDATTWATVPAYERDHQAKDVMEMMEKNEMPPANYTWLHGDARLDDTQRGLLNDFFRAQRDGSWDIEKARRRAAGASR